MSDTVFVSDVRDNFLKFTTHATRFKNLLRSLMELDSELDIKILCHMAMNPEYKDDFNNILERKKEFVLDLGEVIEIIGQDLQEFGNIAIKKNEEYIEKLKEIQKLKETITDDL